ncbi:hypothetical protein H5410_025411 [Solanum commersonii]|uniref:Cold-shock domain-containing protein n=1 Tax=Solanum commersonii TaxID=4109 RepID=A0A9J5YVW3_SOLCO|nr:hypothetical protein H5410_025411 [Solanum commersonii]
MFVSANGQRAKGTVKWFSDDLFVHQSGIRYECFHSLSAGEAIEFKIESYCDGGTKAVDVTVPDGAAV